MKKGLKIILSIVLLIVIFIIILSIFFSIKGNKKSITEEKFISEMTNIGYTSSKVTTSSTVIDTYLAEKDNLKIYFNVASSEQLATNNFNIIKSKYENLKVESSAETSVSINSYSKYTLLNNEYYMVVTRIGNTVMYAQVDKQEKDIVKDIFKQLGY